jgi:hypothetical protein
MSVDSLNLRRAVLNCPQMAPAVALSVVSTMWRCEDDLRTPGRKFKNVFRSSIRHFRTMAMETSLEDHRSEEILNELEPESNRESATV